MSYLRDFPTITPRQMVHGQILTMVVNGNDDRKYLRLLLRFSFVEDPLGRAEWGAFPKKDYLLNFRRNSNLLGPYHLSWKKHHEACETAPRFPL